MCCRRERRISPKLRYGGEICYDGVQYSVWDFALVCLFRSLFLEAAIENQQDRRIAHTKSDWVMRKVLWNKNKQ